MHKPDATQRITIKPNNSTDKGATPKPAGTTRQHPPVPTSPSKTTSPPASPLATQQSMKSDSANAPNSNGRKPKENAFAKSGRPNKNAFAKSRNGKSKNAFAKSGNGKSKNEENAKKPNAADNKSKGNAKFVMEKISP